MLNRCTYLCLCANNEYFVTSSTVTNVTIYRVNGDIFYKINNGNKTLLSEPVYNPEFDTAVWFGAAPTDEFLRLIVFNDAVPI